MYIHVVTTWPFLSDTLSLLTYLFPLLGCQQKVHVHTCGHNLAFPIWHTITVNLPVSSPWMSAEGTCTYMWSQPSLSYLTHYHYDDLPVSSPWTQQKVHVHTCGHNLAFPIWHTITMLTNLFPLFGCQQKVHVHTCGHYLAFPIWHTITMMTYLFPLLGCQQKVHVHTCGHNLAFFIWHTITMLTNLFPLLGCQQKVPWVKHDLV